MTEPAKLPARFLRVSGLSCHRGDRELFRGVQFTLGPGEALVVRGANGVGKTTLLHCLAGIVRPALGTVDIGGRGEEERPGTDIHLIGHFAALKTRLTVAENLRFWADLNGECEVGQRDALALLGLDGLEDLDAGALSAGQSRRLSLARLVVTPRPLWLLDEPTASLDAGGERLLRALIEQHLSRGGLAVVSTHHKLDVAGRVTTLALEPGS